MHRRIRVARGSPHSFGRVALPQALAQWRPIVWWVSIGAQYADGAGRVVLTDAVRGRVGGHAAADDEIVVSGHSPSYPQNADRTDTGAATHGHRCCQVWRLGLEVWRSR